MAVCRLHSFSMEHSNTYVDTMSMSSAAFGMTNPVYRHEAEYRNTVVSQWLDDRNDLSQSGLDQVSWKN